MVELDAKRIKIISISIFAVLVIGTEFAWRHPLFNKSLDIEEKLQKSYDLMNFERYFTLIGSEYSLVLLVFIVFLWFPISKTFEITIVMLTSNFINSLIKVWIGNPRPYMERENLYTSCEGGYGNPSGHCMTSLATFLSFAKILIWRYKPRIEYKVMIFVGFSLLIFNIGVSRLFLGLHGINQILYGYLLGFIVYFVYYHILEIEKVNSEIFFAIVSNKKYVIISFIIGLVCIILLPITDNICDRRDDQKYENYKKIIREKCNYKTKEYRLLNAEGIYGGCSITSLPGMMLGIYLFSKKYLSMYPNKFNELDLFLHHSRDGWKGVLKMAGLLVCSIIPMISNILVPNNANNYIAYVFKVGLPLFLSTILIFGFASSFSVKLFIANRDIYKTEVVKQNNSLSEDDLKLLA